MMEITFRPSEQEAGSTVFGELIEKKEVTILKGKTNEHEAMLYKIKTSFEVPGMLGPKEMVVVIWGTKILDQLMEPFNIGDFVKITYQGKQDFAKGDFTWSTHQWEVEELVDANPSGH